MKKVKPTFSVEEIAKATGLDRDDDFGLSSILAKTRRGTMCPGIYTDKDAGEKAISYVHVDSSMIPGGVRGRPGNKNSFKINLGTCDPTPFDAGENVLPGTNISSMSGIAMIKTYPWSDQYEVAEISYASKHLPSEIAYDRDTIEAFFDIFKKFHADSDLGQRTDFSEVFAEFDAKLEQFNKQFAGVTIERSFNTFADRLEYLVAEGAFELELA